MSEPPRRPQGLPEDWPRVEIGSLRPFVTSGSRGWARYYAETGAPFIRITNLSRESVDLDLADLKFVQLPPSAAAEATRTELRDGDVLISITADIGIVGIVDGRIPKPAYMNQHIALLRFDASCADSRFVAYYLASEASQRLFKASMDVGAKAGMSLLTIRKLRVAYPPRKEQTAIASALREVDALEENLDALLSKKRAIKQGVMQQLLTGRTRLPGFSGEWPTRRIGETGGFLRTANNPRSDLRAEGETRYIHYGDVHTHRASRLNCATANLPCVDARRAGGAAELRDGDLVIVDASEDLDGVGKSVEVVGTSGMSVVAGLHTIAFRGEPRYWALGYKAYLQFTPAFRKALLRVASGISVYAISKAQIASVELPIPLVDEQRAIAEVLSDMDTEIEALERRKAKTQAIKEGMMQALLTGRVRLVEPRQKIETNAVVGISA